MPEVLMRIRPIRLVAIGVSVASSAVVGAVWRVLRRAARRPPRVTHGICPLHSLRDSVLADRAAGTLARSVVLYARQTTAFDLTTEAEFDVVFSASAHEAVGKYSACLCYVLLATDVWSTSFKPFLPGRNERSNSLILGLMKAVGIRIVAFPYGSDVAWRDRNRDRFDWVGMMQLGYPDWDLVQWGEAARANERVISHHADLVIGMDGSLRRFLSRNDLYCKNIPIDTRFLLPGERIHDSDVPVIVHAPNHRNVKGTPFLLDALERLRQRGFRFELRVIEGMARADAIAAYRDADIVADQFVMGAFGILALECLALGKPVLTYLDHDHLASPLFNLPVVNANRDNLAEVLAVLLRVPELRARIGAAGRAAVEKYHSLEAIGELNKVIYEHVWWRKPLAVEGTAHFGPERQPRSFTEDPAIAEFWPVDTTDLEPRISEALADLRQLRAAAAPPSQGAPASVGETG